VYLDTETINTEVIVDMLGSRLSNLWLIVSITKYVPWGEV